jgi:hypothetical protein
MKTTTMLAAFLVLGAIIGGSGALAQTTTAPNSGAGVPGLPGNKSGPPLQPSEQSTVRPDQSNVPGLPGNKSGLASQPPTGLQDQAQSDKDEDEDMDGFFHRHPGMMGFVGRGYGHGAFEGRRAKAQG